MNPTIISFCLIGLIGLVYLIDFFIKSKKSEPTSKKIDAKTKVEKPSDVFYNKGWYRIHFIIVISFFLFSLCVSLYGLLIFDDNLKGNFFNDVLKVILDRNLDIGLYILLFYLFVFLIFLPLIYELVDWVNEGFGKNKKASKKQYIIFSSIGSIFVLFLFFYFLTGFYLPNYYYRTGDCKKANSYYKIFNSGKYEKCISPGYWNKRLNKWHKAR